MEDADARWVWDSYPEFQFLFGSFECVSQWLNEPGMCWEADLIRRRPDGSLVLGKGYSVAHTRREVMRLHGMILLERELWLLELQVMTAKRRVQFHVQKSTR